MGKNVVTIDVQKTVYDAAVLMTENKKGCIIITKREAPVGIITERDIVRRFVYKSLLQRDVKVFEIMSKPLVTIDPDSPIREAARLMVKNAIRRLPVVKDNKLVGIVTSTDFAKHLSQKTITEGVLEAMARYPSVPPYS